ncbi:DgyrCDS8373 [Dimorphilus gyrociliatus]|uniref:Mitochondrial ribonuclease P catalytic subunit n=1 Tax=Dimorphilus gyrociliatus TaxID=2664684 RepID=A0A7I8VVM9_9ANNE|nr:DgyrCDS8373 [Dimorphilus gyrociliatus]
MFKLLTGRGLRPILLFNNFKGSIRTIKSDARNDEHFQTVLSFIKDNQYKDIDFWVECDRKINSLNINERFKQVWTNALLRHYAHQSDLKKDDFELGISLYDYMKSKKVDDRNRLTILSAALRLCGERGSSETDRIDQLLTEIHQIADFFDVDTCQSIIIGLSATDRWRDGYRYLDMAKLTSHTLGPEFYSPLFRAALRFDDKKEVDKLAKALHEHDVYVSEKIVNYFIQKGKKWLLDLLFYYYEYRWIPGARQMELIKEAFVREGYCINNIEPRKSTCPCCSQKLLPLPKLGLTDFERLRRSFLKLAVERDDIFLSTTIEELQRFITFMNESGRFDMIVDGLNVAYAAPKHITLKQRAELLRSVINYLVDVRRKRVLVLGRKHMLSWPGKFMDEIQDKAKCFFVDNKSEDDKMTLYAALSSGRQTQIVTLDELRDHKYLLGGELGLKANNCFLRYGRELIKYHF